MTKYSDLYEGKLYSGKEIERYKEPFTDRRTNEEIIGLKSYMSKIKESDRYKENILSDLFRENKLSDKFSKEKFTIPNISLENLTREFNEIPININSGHFGIPITPPLTPEELERRRRLSELGARFGIVVPFDLTNEEIGKLSDEQVDPLAVRGFVFLRERGESLVFPESMDGQFSAAVDKTAREYVQRQYQVSTQLPLDRLLDVTNLSLSDESTGRVIRIADGVDIQKNFPLGKVYGSLPISGLRERVNPLEATALLVYGLIGKKRENVQAAFQAFEKGKLEVARRAFQSSHLSAGKAFTHIAPYLAQLQQGDSAAAEQILGYFQQSVKTEEISDLVEGVRGLFNVNRGFSHVDVKMQDGVYEDLFDNTRLMSCTFLPGGAFKDASIGYHGDPDVGLLHISPRDIEKRLSPIGVSILLNAGDANGNKWLIVDSVEGGRDLERIRESLWMPAVYDGIVGVARDVGSSRVLFNSKLFNARPRQFVNFVSKKHPSAKVILKKTGLTDYSHLGVSSFGSREAFETWGESGRKGEVNGCVLELTK